jgi:hypothetical protein
MADGYLLSEGDRQRLQKLIDDHGMTRIQHVAQDAVLGAPEVYIAKVQSTPGSIPALTEAGEGESYAHPGYAPCDIYQILPGVESANWDLTPISKLSFPVFNLSTSEITDDWILVIRSKSGHWIASTSTPGFDRITGLTTAAVETTDGTFEIYNISVVKGADPREDTSSTAEAVTIVNTPAWKMADNQRIFAHWDERLNSGDGGWEVYLIYSTVTVVTDVTISGGKLKKKTKTVGVFYAGTESDWSAGTDVHESADYDEITFMTNVQVSGTTLQKKTRTVKAYNPDSNAESDWSTWHTGTTCE